MSFTAAAFIVVAIWCLIGFLVSVYMRRRGHAFFTWWYLGSILGPLSIPLALDAVAREGRATRSVPPARASIGHVAMLVGIDGSEAALDAARGAVTLFGDRIGRCTLACVIDYEAASASPARRSEADAALDAAAAALGAVPCDRVVLTGAAAAALASAARDGSYDLLVVGSRGRGASRALLGSVAQRVARGVGVPVLLGATAIVVDDPPPPAL